MKATMMAAATLALVALTGGCATQRAPRRPEGIGAPHETLTQRYGPYCEALGHLEGTPGYDACIAKQHSIYRGDE